MDNQNNILHVDPMTNLVQAVEDATPEEVVKMRTSVADTSSVEAEGGEDGYSEEIKNISLDSSYEDLLINSPNKELSESNASIFDVAEGKGTEISDEVVEDRVKDQMSAMFDLPDEEKAEYEATFTDENGELPDILLMPGQYAFREVLAPDGYALNEAVCIFVVDAQGQVSGDTEIRDDWTRFSLRKTDTGGRVLAGVQFALVDADGNQIMTAETDENGLASFERIPYGRYTVVETQPLPGYLPAGTVAELTVDGQYVNPDAPLEVVNVPADTPDIQTGVDLPFTPLMWAGVGMTAGGLVLIGVYGYRRRKRRNRFCRRKNGRQSMNLPNRLISWKHQRLFNMGPVPKTKLPIFRKMP